MTPEEAERASYTRFVGSVILLISLIVGLAIITWQSDQAWGGLPGATGGGLIVYLTVAAGIAIMAGYVLWTWSAWRDSAS